MTQWSESRDRRARYASPENLLANNTHVARARRQVRVALITLAEREQQNNHEHQSAGSHVARHGQFFPHFSTYHISKRRGHSMGITGARGKKKRETEVGWDLGVSLQGP